MSKTGRPTTFTEDIAATICEEVAEGKSLRTICAIKGRPSLSSVMKWLREKPLFSQHYARAKQIAADAMAEEILAIADDGLNDTYVDEDGNERTDHDVIARSKLRVDARKWLASKLAPKKYGDRLDVAHEGDVNLRVVIGGDPPSETSVDGGA